MVIDGKVYVGPQNLLKELWPDPNDRPSIRWLQRQQKARTIPFVKLGQFVWFNTTDVRGTIEKKFTIKAR